MNIFRYGFYYQKIENTAIYDAFQYDRIPEKTVYMKSLKRWLDYDRGLTLFGNQSLAVN